MGNNLGYGFEDFIIFKVCTSKIKFGLKTRTNYHMFQFVRVRNSGKCKYSKILLVAI